MRIFKIYPIGECCRTKKCVDVLKILRETGVALVLNEAVEVINIKEEF